MPDADTDQAVEIMMSHRFRHPPVIDGGSLVGIVSLRDIVRTRSRPRIGGRRDPAFRTS